MNSTESHRVDTSKPLKSNAIDINLKRTTSHLTTQNELNSRSNENMFTTSSSSLNPHDQLFNQRKSISFDLESPSNSRSHQRSKSNSHRDQPRNPLNHTKSCSSELFTTKSDQNSKKVKKLARQYMRKESQSLPNDMLVDFSLNSDEIAQVCVDEPPVPIGIVKRQVESINFKSRPCMSSQPNDSVNLDENTRGSSNEFITTENRKSFLVIGKKSHH